MPKSKKLYCSCRQPAEGFMIKCEECMDWFHGPCVKVTLKSSRKLCKWYCNPCSLHNRCKKVEEELDLCLRKVKAVEQLQAESLEKNNCHQDQIDQGRQLNVQDETLKKTRNSMTKSESSLYEQDLVLKETNKHLIIALCQAAKDERDLRLSAEKSSVQVKLLQTEIKSLRDEIKGLKNRSRLSLKKK